MTATAIREIGSQQRAEQIASYHHGTDEWAVPDGFDFLAKGDHRVVYVDHDMDIVWKLGIDAVNRREVETLAELRNDGADHAPDATLWTVEVDVRDPWGESVVDVVACTLVAMPFLPEDGSVEHDGVILPGAGDLNPANTVSHGGKLWLIDAGGLW